MSSLTSNNDVKRLARKTIYEAWGAIDHYLLNLPNKSSSADALLLVAESIEKLMMPTNEVLGGNIQVYEDD